VITKKKGKAKTKKGGRKRVKFRRGEKRNKGYAKKERMLVGAQPVKEKVP